MFAEKAFMKRKRKLHKTYSMQFRFLTTVISAMLAVTIFIGGLSSYEVERYIQEQAENFVKVTCENEGRQINNLFGDMEKSVEIMASYVMDFFKSKADFEDRSLQEKVIISADKMFADVARHTSGAVAYYLRFDPAISDGQSGLFYSKQDGGEEYISFEPTNLLLYEKDDIEHVGWFWQPYEAGKSVWMQPYYNQNNHILMISYVVPLYCEEMFVGVVGMDFDYTVLTARVNEISIYEHGFAYLEMAGVAVDLNSREAQAKRMDDSAQYLSAAHELENGMTLVLAANDNDIRQIRYEMVFKILFVAFVLFVLVTIVVIYIVKKMVEPLRKITNASLELSKGNYDIEIIHSNTQEIKLLNTVFENMAVHLREREKLLQLYATHDSLTGLRNTHSYKRWVTEFDQKIESESVDFGIVVLDINYLKENNDQYGHDVGDEYITNAAKLISDIFKRSPVFRIGGDEFVVVLQNRDLEEYKELLVQFDYMCANAFIAEKIKIPVSIARGFARFRPESDFHFVDVFKRADAAMYEHKRKIKSNGVPFATKHEK